MTQPLPVPGRQDVTEAVIEDLRARNQLGVQTYGTPLQTHNGRDALLDMYEELLDAVKYMKQYLMERENDRTS